MKEIKIIELKAFYIQLISPKNEELEMNENKHRHWRNRHTPFAFKVTYNDSHFGNIYTNYDLINSDSLAAMWDRKPASSSLMIRRYQHREVTRAANVKYWFRVETRYKKSKLTLNGRRSKHYQAQSSHTIGKESNFLIR